MVLGEEKTEERSVGEANHVVYVWDNLHPASAAIKASTLPREVIIDPQACKIAIAFAPQGEQEAYGLADAVQQVTYNITRTSTQKSGHDEVIASRMWEEPRHFTGRCNVGKGKDGNPLVLIDLSECAQDWEKQSVAQLLERYIPEPAVDMIADLQKQVLVKADNGRVRPFPRLDVLHIAPDVNYALAL